MTVRRWRAPLMAAAVLIGIHAAILAASLGDYRVSVDSGYHVAMARWYAAHGSAYWDHVSFAPAGRPNLQGPALHMAIARIGSLLGGSGDALVTANAILAFLQWCAAIVTAAYFARRYAGEWGALGASTLLAGNAFSSYSFSVGIPSGWTFIAAPWAIHFFLRERLLACVAVTSLAIYVHLAAFATMPVGLLAAAVLTRRWRALALVGAGVLFATSPYWLHLVRHAGWLRGTRGQAAPGLTLLLNLLALPMLVRIVLTPRAHPLLSAWLVSTLPWLLQNPLRFLGQANLLAAVLAGVWLARATASMRPRLRNVVATAFVLLATMQWALNESSLRANLGWLGGVRYPRAVDWSEAHRLAEVLTGPALLGRTVSTYNPTQCTAIAAYAPVHLEKGHWVEVQPVRDPADAVPAAEKVYVLAMATDDRSLASFQQRGWIEIHGGSRASSVVTISAARSVQREVRHAATAVIETEAGWLATRAVHNTFWPTGIALEAWRRTLQEQRTHAGRLQLATLLLAWSEEEADARRASRLRAAARGAGSLAYFVGDEGSAHFVSAGHHRLMQIHAARVSEAAKRIGGEEEPIDMLLDAYVALFDDYFRI